MRVRIAFGIERAARRKLPVIKALAQQIVVNPLTKWGRIGVLMQSIQRIHDVPLLTGIAGALLPTLKAKVWS
jgi:hypothetical protein